MPIYIDYIKTRGGVSDEEFVWLRCEDENPDYPIHMLNAADDLLLYPKKIAVFEKSMFVLTLTLAIMAFFPGGVRMFGLEFCSTEDAING